MENHFEINYQIPNVDSIGLFKSLVKEINNTAELLGFKNLSFDDSNYLITGNFELLETKDRDYFTALSCEEKNNTFGNELSKLERLCGLVNADNIIILRNGTQLRCNLLDSIRTGERNFNYNASIGELFDNNIYLFLKHAKEIMKDSRMFLSPINTHRFSPFFSSTPTLGGFSEWWQFCKKNGIEKNGFPICYISGNPMTGSNFCKAITPEGETVRAKVTCSFIDLLKSFGSVNSKYRYLPEFCHTYTIIEIINKLNNTSK